MEVKGWKLRDWGLFILSLVIFIVVFILIAKVVGIGKESGFWAFMFYTFLPIVCSYAITKHIKEKRAEIKVIKED